MLVVWVLVTGGAAWVESRGAMIRMGDALAPDERFPYIRLAVWNGGHGVLKPHVLIDRAVNASGTDLTDPGHYSFELCWSNFPADYTPTLRRSHMGKSRFSVEVAERVRNQGKPVLAIRQRGPYTPVLDYAPTVYLRISAHSEDSVAGSVQRWYRIEFDAAGIPVCPVVTEEEAKQLETRFAAS